MSMNEHAAVRHLTTALAFAYPILAHVAIALSSVTLTVAAIALLAGVALFPALIRGRALAWFAVPVIGAGCWWLGRSPIPVLPLYVAPVLVPAFMAWAFGRTLQPGRTPLIAQLIRLLHTPDDEPEPAVWSYARALTRAWTILFIALASLNLLLAAFAEPDGLLLAAGVTPPVTVPLEWWSWFANLIGYLIVAAFFVIEYAYRRRRFPQQPYRNMFDFLGRMLRTMPGVMRKASGSGSRIADGGWPEHVPGAPSRCSDYPPSAIRHPLPHARMSTHQSTLRVSSSHPSLAGHFPGRSIVPGVVLLDCVLAEAQAWLGRALVVTSLSHAKFIAPLLPEEGARMQLKIAGDELRFKLTRNDEAIAQGAFRVATERSV